MSKSLGKSRVCRCNQCRACRKRRKLRGVPALTKQQEAELIRKMDQEEAAFIRWRNGLEWARSAGSFM